MKAVVCGTAFGRFYLRALAIHPDIELLGILSRGSEASARCACELGIAHYHAVDALPDTVTLACVVVRAGAFTTLSTNAGAACSKRPLHHNSGRYRRCPGHSARAKPDPSRGCR
ncbi:Gfo/Idh/MocA family oxidoreductase [Symbiopectobacterium sp. RP]|uniref:Gfo/Idh/MocA family oxidoreductase n=1 Tax=Symbiopectobacterium sp. RP TaxID=3248553 RepID=UPI003D29FCCE